MFILAGEGGGGNSLHMALRESSNTVHSIIAKEAFNFSGGLILIDFGHFVRIQVWLLLCGAQRVKVKKKKKYVLFSGLC